jgi:hypothetical protein
LLGYQAGEITHELVARKTQRLLKRLPTLPSEKRLSSEDAGSILLAVWEQVDEEGELEKLEIPGIFQALDLDLLLEYDFPWTAPRVREGISVIAKPLAKPQRRSFRAPLKRLV